MIHAALGQFVHGNLVCRDVETMTSLFCEPKMLFVIIYFNIFNPFNTGIGRTVRPSPSDVT